MGKTILIISIILLLIVGCQPVKSDKPVSEIKIDTLEAGTYGDSSYSLVIKAMLDTVELESHHLFFYNGGKCIRDYYNDSSGTKRFWMSINPGYKKQEYNKAFYWDDKWGQTIINIDSLFISNNIKKIEYTVHKENPYGLDNLLFSFKREYRRGIIRKTEIWDFDASKAYLEEDGEYYDLDTDLPSKYAEWDYSYKEAFGRALVNFSEAFALAYLRIDRRYLEIPKEKHNVELKNIMNNLF